MFFFANIAYSHIYIWCSLTVERSAEAKDYKSWQKENFRIMNSCLSIVWICYQIQITNKWKTRRSALQVIPMLEHKNLTYYNFVGRSAIRTKWYHALYYRLCYLMGKT